MNVLNARDELIRKEQNGLQGKFPIAEVEQILQAGTQKVKDHGIVVTLGAEPTHKGNANPTGEGLVDTSFIFQLGMFGFDALEFDSYLFTRDDIGTCERLGSCTRSEHVGKVSYQGRCLQSCHYRFCDRYGIYFPHEDPTQRRTLAVVLVGQQGYVTV